MIGKVKILTDNPHSFFLVSIPIFTLIGFIIGNESVEISVNDAFYVIEYIDLIKLVSIVFVVIGAGYWAMKKTNRKLNKWLTLLHISLTFGGIILMTFFFTQLIETNELSKSDDFAHNIGLEVLITITAQIVIVGQLFYPINLLIGVIKKRDK